MSANAAEPLWADDHDEEDDDWDDVAIDDTYLTFRLDNIEYAISVANVKEIVRLPKFIEVPDVPHFIRGVINLRGQVIPLMDARMRLGLPEVPYTDRMVAIVLESRNVLTGLVADGVNGVSLFPPDKIDEPPKGGKNERPGRVRAMRGLGRVGDDVCIILDASRLLGESEIESLASLEAKLRA